MRSVILEADGGSRGNPGPAGYGAVVKDADTGQVLAEAAAAIGTATNNVAEYGGLVAGLKAAAALDPDVRVEVRMDSKLVVEQMSGRWKIKHEDMRRLAREARAVLPPENVHYSWIPRAMNKHADRLANEAMDAAARGEVWTSTSGVPADGDGGPATDVDVRPAQGYEGDVAPREALRLLESEPAAVLVDCRTQPEWAYVGVPDLSSLGRRVLFVEWQRYPDGAVNPHFVDEIRRAGVPDDAPLVFLCRSGVRSVAAARAVTAEGMGPAYNVLEGFEGGLDPEGHRGASGWRARGLPWRQS